MVFKLVRIDAEEPNKIQLPPGTHLIGRGKFLNCEDKRISRNHGNLIITEDSVVIEALHQNPCFFTKKGSEEKQLLKKSFKEKLENGDRFGLLPASYWFEVMYCTGDADSQATDVSNTQELDPCVDQNNEESQINKTVNDENVNNLLSPTDEQTVSGQQTEINSEEFVQQTVTRERNEEVKQNEEEGNEDSVLNFDLNETVENAGRAESPSLLDQQNEPQHSPLQSVDPEPPSPTTTDNTDQPIPPETTEAQMEQEITASKSHKSSSEEEDVVRRIKTEPSESKSPKRSHSPEEEEGVKRIKTELLEAKEEVKQDPDAVAGGAGPSSGQADQASASDAADGKAPPSPAPAPAPPRERCIYGADCYRRNPAHKAQFAHPRDADWGAGEQAPCPYGAACRKREPRHWRVHSHPPQARMPAPGAQVVERHGNVFYINARAVNFYDDHFQVEDDDGDSVDFDYEF